jgi:hypothetical protein
MITDNPVTMSEAPQMLAAVLAPHASPEALAAFTSAAGRAGDLIDNSLPHLQELLRLTINHLALVRPGVDDGGQLSRLADGAATDADIDELAKEETREILAWVYDGDWDFPGAPALAAGLYLDGNPSIDRDVVDAALVTLADFLDNTEETAAGPAPVREIFLVESAPAVVLPAAA